MQGKGRWMPRPPSTRAGLGWAAGVDTRAVPHLEVPCPARRPPCRHPHHPATRCLPAGRWGRSRRVSGSRRPPSAAAPAGRRLCSAGEEHQRMRGAAKDERRGKA